jgi:hypothetical protein
MIHFHTIFLPNSSIFLFYFKDFVYYPKSLSEAERRKKRLHTEATMVAMAMVALQSSMTSLSLSSKSFFGQPITLPSLLPVRHSSFTNSSFNFDYSMCFLSSYIQLGFFFNSSSF